MYIMKSRAALALDIFMDELFFAKRNFGLLSRYDYATSLQYSRTFKLILRNGALYNSDAEQSAKRTSNIDLINTFDIIIKTVHHRPLCIFFCVMI